MELAKKVETNNLLSFQSHFLMAGSMNGNPVRQLQISYARSFEEIDLTCSAPLYANKEKRLKLFVKNMVSTRCKMFVTAVLRNLGLQYVKVELGEIEILETITPVQLEQLRITLLNSGLELINDSRSILVEKTKSAIREMIHYPDEMPRLKNSVFLSEKLGYHYTYLANVFSHVAGTTIEKYIISHKIERVKELIVQGEFTLSEIAWKVNYSSVAHLSNQFKKITGLRVSEFKKIKDKKLVALENVS